MTAPRHAGRPDPPPAEAVERDGDGLFLVFEGVEGCGKSTQIEHLTAFLEARGRRCRVTREPGGTPVGESIRELLLDPAQEGIDGLTELFLLEAGRRAHVRQVIAPLRDAGWVVIADRYADSSVAYQGGGRELGVELVERLNRIATGGLRADLTFLLDLPVEEGLARVARRHREEDRLEREQISFHERVRAAYLDLARRHRERYRVLDATRPPEEIARAIQGELRPLL